jgi:hypothetical protein
VRRFRGLTKHQEGVLGWIAIGIDTGHHPATLKALLDRGLIIRLIDRPVGQDAFGVISIPQYEVPIPIHVEWCQWCDDNTPENSTQTATQQDEPGKVVGEIVLRKEGSR